MFEQTDNTPKLSRRQGCSMDYSEFKQSVNLSRQDFYRRIFMENRANIRVKKEDTVVKNLEKIFCAALRLSNRNGFQAMSIRDLGREAGLSMGALYAYFSSKEELFGMLQTQAQVHVRRILEEWISRESHPAARLRTAIQTHLYLSEDLQPWFYFSFMEAKTFGADDAASIRSNEEYIEDVVRDILENGVRTGIFAARNCHLTASAVKALLQDWYLTRWRFARDHISIDQYVAFTIALVESFCMAENPSSEDHPA
jgi:AcrR family transcriptional regulator